LPATVAPLASPTVTGNYSIQVETAMAQLPTGAVRVRFAELRKSAPPGNFAENGNFDDTLVDLPLAQILAGLNPMLLTRRAGQRQVDLPDEVDMAFKPGARSIAPRPMVEPLPAVIHKLSDPVEATPQPAAPVPAPAPEPAPKLPEPKPAAPVPVVDGMSVKLSAVCEFWPESVRQDITQNNWQEASVSLPMKRLEEAMKKGRVAFIWSELIQWLDVAPPSQPTAHGNTSVDIPLKVVAPLFMGRRRPVVVQRSVSIGENVPDLFDLPATSTRVSPIAAPEPPPEPAPAVETPAPASAPVAEAPVPPAPGPVVETVAAAPVVDTLPTASAPSPESAPAPEAVVETVPVAPEPAPAPVVSEQKVEELAKVEESPQEIVQKINVLPGVAASLIAMSDGFLVAGDLPAPLKGEMTAAFLPQMFGRQAHYAKEIQLGAPTELFVLAGETPFKVFKAGTLFLAVLGKPGETLPEASLRAVATELAKRNP
jgi:predicted regulator of Ras-like GTPase activity (Roadblock/LC7/MglB family)